MKKLLKIFLSIIALFLYVEKAADEDDADSRRELAEKGYTLPEYAFTVECGGV